MVLLILSLLLALMLPASVNAGGCTLCGNSITNTPKRMNFLVEPGTRCQDVYINSYGYYNQGDSQCRRVKNSYEDICCGDEEPETIVQPTQAPGPGPQDSPCPVCRLTNEYPGKPEVFIVARYVGDYTCHELFQRGNAGLIPPFMCGPLQGTLFT